MIPARAGELGEEIATSLRKPRRAAAHEPPGTLPPARLRAYRRQERANGTPVEWGERIKGHSGEFTMPRRAGVQAVD